MIKVYGISDDLIKIEGEINEEINSSGGTLIFPNGSIIQIDYGREGEWDIKVIRKGQATIQLTICEDNIEHSECYSDEIVIDNYDIPMDHAVFVEAEAGYSIIE